MASAAPNPRCGSELDLLMEEFIRLISALRAIHAATPITNRDLLRFLAVAEINDGQEPSEVARRYRSTAGYLNQKLDDLRSRGLVALVPDIADQLTDSRLQSRRKGIAQMLLGTLAEQQFVKLAREVTGGRDFRIEDHVRARSDTDFRLFNGQDRPLLRMNIKFHGTLFRQAREQVDLEPEDCFALATYKINIALQRQHDEALPYVFVVLSAPGLTAESVGQRIPDEHVWTVSACRGRREIEEGVVSLLLGSSSEWQFGDLREQLVAAQFRVISARRAYNTMRERLFERVFALRQRAFTSAFRNAEIDMHLSLSQEMTPLQEFFRNVARLSPQELAVRLDRGDM
jgi:hypothetical protein